MISTSESRQVFSFRLIGRLINEIRVIIFSCWYATRSVAEDRLSAYPSLVVVRSFLDNGTGVLGVMYLDDTTTGKPAFHQIILLRLRHGVEELACFLNGLLIVVKVIKIYSHDKIKNLW